MGRRKPKSPAPSATAEVESTEEDDTKPSPDDVEFKHRPPDGVVHPHGGMVHQAQGYGVVHPHAVVHPSVVHPHQHGFAPSHGAYVHQHSFASPHSMYDTSRAPNTRAPSSNFMYPPDVPQGAGVFGIPQGMYGGYAYSGSDAAMMFGAYGCAPVGLPSSPTFVGNAAANFGHPNSFGMPPHVPHGHSRGVYGVDGTAYGVGPPSATPPSNGMAYGVGCTSYPRPRPFSGMTYGVGHTSYPCPHPSSAVPPSNNVMSSRGVGNTSNTPRPASVMSHGVGDALTSLLSRGSMSHTSSTSGGNTSNTLLTSHTVQDVGATSNTPGDVGDDSNVLLSSISCGSVGNVSSMSPPSERPSTSAPGGTNRPHRQGSGPGADTEPHVSHSTISAQAIARVLAEIERSNVTVGKWYFHGEPRADTTFVRELPTQVAGENSLPLFVLGAESIEIALLRPPPWPPPWPSPIIKLQVGHIMCTKPEVRWSCLDSSQALAPCLVTIVCQSCLEIVDKAPGGAVHQASGGACQLSCVPYFPTASPSIVSTQLLCPPNSKTVDEATRTVPRVTGRAISRSRETRQLYLAVATTPSFRGSCLSCFSTASSSCIALANFSQVRTARLFSSYAADSFLRYLFGFELRNRIMSTSNLFECATLRLERHKLQDIARALSNMIKLLFECYRVNTSTTKRLRATKTSSLGIVARGSCSNSSSRYVHSRLSVQDSLSNYVTRLLIQSFFDKLRPSRLFTQNSTSSFNELHVHVRVSVNERVCMCVCFRVYMCPRKR